MILLFAEKSLEGSLPENQTSAANTRWRSYTFAVPGLTQAGPFNPQSGNEALAVPSNVQPLVWFQIKEEKYSRLLCGWREPYSRPAKGPAGSKQGSGFCILSCLSEIIPCTVFPSLKFSSA